MFPHDYETCWVVSVVIEDRCDREKKTRRVRVLMVVSLAGRVAIRAPGGGNKVELMNTCQMSKSWREISWDKVKSWKKRAWGRVLLCFGGLGQYGLNSPGAKIQRYILYYCGSKAWDLMFCSLLCLSPSFDRKHFFEIIFFPKKFPRKLTHHGSSIQWSGVWISGYS